MKKYMHFMHELLKEQRAKYWWSLVAIFFMVFLTLFSTYLVKVVVDTFTVSEGNTLPDIFFDDKLGPIGIAIVFILGGADFIYSNKWILAIAVIVVGILLAGITILRGLMRSYITSGISAKIRIKLFEHIERMPYSYIKKHSNGDLLQTCMRDESVLRTFLGYEVMGLAYTIDMVIISIIILFTVNWIIALIIVILVPPLFLYSAFILKFIRKRYRETDDKEAIVTGKIEENINSIRVVKAYNNEKYEMEEFDEDLKNYSSKYIRWRRLASFYYATSDMLIYVAIIVTTLVAGFLCFNGKINVGTVVLATSYTSMVVWPVRQCAQVLGDYTRATVAIDRMNLILETPIEDIETGSKPEIKGNIVLKNVNFHYDDSNVDALHDVNLEIKQGTTVAIMGKTGSGKSTLALLLNRLYDYDDGSIKIDGVELKDISKKHIRENIATVLQEPFIFSRTIYQNLTIAKTKLDKEEIYKAAKIANFHDDILKFDKGYETMVGERGTTLSGGQRQRLAMARTILNNAPILIFDDSLSAVDAETDIKIRSALKNRSKKVTTLIVTHRIMTAKDADQIIVLDNGTISESGTHKELIKKDGFYKLVYEMQTRTE